MQLRELVEAGVFPKKDLVINIIEYYKGNQETECNGTDDISEDLLDSEVLKIRPSQWKNTINIIVE